MFSCHFQYDRGKDIFHITTHLSPLFFPFSSPPLLSEPWERFPPSLLPATSDLRNLFVLASRGSVAALLPTAGLIIAPFPENPVRPTSCDLDRDLSGYSTPEATL